MEVLKNNSFLMLLDFSNNEFGEVGGMYIVVVLVCFCLLIKQYYNNFFISVCENVYRKINFFFVFLKKKLYQIMIYNYKY